VGTHLFVPVYSHKYLLNKAKFSQGKTKQKGKNCTIPESVLSLDDIVYEEEKE